MRNLKDLATSESSGLILEALTKAAILDPAEEVRKEAIGVLTNLTSKGIRLRKGFVGDNQIMVELAQEGHKELFYVCDLPKEYVPGYKVEPHSFVIPE